jgi:hypothetical protein
MIYRQLMSFCKHFWATECWYEHILVKDIFLTSTKIYRCWIVYEKTWQMIVFSLLLWLGTAACTAMNIQIETSLHSHALITSRSLQPVIILFWVLTIAQNFLTTGLPLLQL